MDEQVKPRLLKNQMSVQSQLVSSDTDKPEIKERNKDSQCLENNMWNKNI